MNQIGPPLLILLVAQIFSVLAAPRAPKLNVHSGDVYHGYVKEGETVVNLRPQISVIDESGPVCSYEIKEPTDIDDAPFTFKVIDKHTGKVELQVKRGIILDCSHSEYRIEFVAKRCDDEEESDRSEIIITVEDTNNHAPQFQEEYYAAEVEEGRIYDEIAKIKATDKDCHHPHGEICHYEITNSEKQEFEVTDDGIVKNKSPLDALNKATHHLEIVAVDCSSKRSPKVTLDIKVIGSCHMALKEIPTRVEYAASSGSIVIAPNAKVDLCDEQCKIDNIETKVTLNTDHIGQGCDRESFASATQRSVCEVNKDTVELLPRPSEVKKEDRGNDVTQWNNDNDDDEVYLFDGASNAIVVPMDTAKAVVPKIFTVSFAMKHDRHPKSSSHFKENILCSSDHHKMNRHHFSVYIRHCKLEILLRTEGGDKVEEKYRPSEWRYTMGEVCDGQWHHYTINFNFPQIDLFVDGRAFPMTNKNPDILDDFPIPSRKDLKLKLVVGACWHGRSQKMDQFFKGWLASMLYLPKQNERPGVLQCLHQCKEQLKVEGVEHIAQGCKAILNNEMSEVTLEADSVNKMNKLIKRVAYLNTREKPTPGHRQFNINTKITCSDKRSPLELKEASGYILVVAQAKPMLSLSGNTRVTKDDQQVKAGTNLFPDIKINLTDSQTGKDISGSWKLDWCKVTVSPQLDNVIEYFSSPAALIGALNLDFTHEKDGLHLTGKESVHGYEQVIQQIHYFNVKPEDSQIIHFSVQCATHSDVISEPMTVDVTLVHAKVEAPHIDKIVATIDDKDVTEVKKTVQHMQSHNDDKSVNMDSAHLHEMTKHEDIEDKLRQRARLQETLRLDTPGARVDFTGSQYYDSPGATVAGGTVATVVIVCVGLLLTLVVVGVLKMKASTTGYRKASSAEQGELAWDDAGLNIVVNPLEEVEKSPPSQCYSDDDDSSDDGDADASYTSDSCSEDEEGGPPLPHLDARSTGLQWDDAPNLSPNNTANRSSLYRV